MSFNKFSSDSYLVNPSSIKFDKIAGFNKDKSSDEYDALVRSLRKGQVEPIYIKNGLCGDGRHRVKACIELGKDVLAIDVNPEISDKEYLEMCNKNTFTSRNDSATQKAIKAYNMTKFFGYERAEAALALGIKDSKVIGYVSFIADSRFSFVLDDLLKGEAANINGKRTKSIDVAKRTIAKIIEEENMPDSKMDKKIEIDFDEHIESEKGKEIFWRLYGNSSELTIDGKLESISVLNIAYPKVK